MLHKVTIEKIDSLFAVLFCGRIRGFYTTEAAAKIGAYDFMAEHPYFTLWG